MPLAQLFRSFRPLQNPIGFGSGDFVLLAFALLLALVLVGAAFLKPYAAKLARRSSFTMIFLGALAGALRLLLLAQAPAPVPAGADDFSYLLLADTLTHWRLANAIHPLHQFFEAVFILQEPTYSSIYPLGQGIVLAAGRLLFGSYWAGVLLSLGVFVALCYWMLRGWTSPRWAFVGGCLAIAQFGPLSPWTNSYWGGFVSACAGCVAFGSLPRIRSTKDRYTLALGVALAVQALTRPFECLLLVLCVLAYALAVKRTWAVAVSLVGLLPATALTAWQNKSVTDDWRKLPYLESRYQYGVPTTFTFQPNPTPHRNLTSEQELDYRAQSAIHGSGRDSLGSFFARLAFRLRFVRFFVLAPLFISVVFFWPELRSAQGAGSAAKQERNSNIPRCLPGSVVHDFHRRRDGWWVLGSIAVFFAGTGFYPYFYPHYVAAASCLFLLVLVKGLENLAAIRSGGFLWGRTAARLLLALSAAHFLFWYGLHLAGSEQVHAATAYETWDYLNRGDPEGRLRVRSELAQTPGQALVFVRYAAGHRFSEWIGNEADIDRAGVVWALDLGVAENQNLIRHFPSRKLWLIEPDRRPPHLTPYTERADAFEPVH